LKFSYLEGALAAAQVRTYSLWVQGAGQPRLDLQAHSPGVEAAKVFPEGLFRDLMNSRLGPASTAGGSAAAFPRGLGWAPYRWGDLFLPVLFEGGEQAMLIAGPGEGGEQGREQLAARFELALILDITTARLAALQQIFRETLFESTRLREATVDLIRNSLLQNVFAVQTLAGKSETLAGEEKEGILAATREMIDSLYWLADLHLPPLAEVDLTLALRSLLDDLAPLGVTASLEHPEAAHLDLSLDQTVGLLRIAREVLYHALGCGARTVRLRLDSGLSDERTSILLTIEVDGRSGDECPPLPLSLFEWAGAIGATVGERAEGPGRKVLIEVPIALSGSGQRV